MVQAKLLTTATIIVCALLAFAAGDASARGTFGYYYGRSFSSPGWTHSANISRSPGQVSGTRSFQTPRGRGATQSFSRTCSGNSCTRSATTTTNSGRTSSHTGTVTHGNGTVSWNRNGTGPNGGTISHSGSCTSGAGCNSGKAVNAPNGNMYSAQRSVTPNGQGGYNYNATLTGPNGSVTRSYP